jgi:hypothetical protein
MRATPGKRLMSSQASAKDPAKPPPAAMSAVTSASTGSGRTGRASPTKTRLSSLGWLILTTVSEVGDLLR